MKYKAILFVFVLLLSLAPAMAAYDLEVSSVTLATAPGNQGDQESIQVTVKNLGPDNIASENINVGINYGNGDTDSQTLVNLNNGASQTFTFQYSWSAGGSFNVKGTVANMNNDNNNANDEKTTTMAINRPPQPTAPADIAFTIGTSAPYTHVMSVSDPDNTAWTFSLTNAPVGMAIDQNTGEITWNPTQVVLPRIVTVNVNDGLATKSVSFNAAAYNNGVSVTTSDAAIKFGDSNTDRRTTSTKTYTITNTGTTTLSALTATLVNVNANYNAVASISTSSLASGASATVTVTMDIPENKDSQEQTVGRVDITDTTVGAQILSTTNLRMEAKSYLRIDKIELEVNGDDEGDLDDGDVYDELKEGDEIKLTITLENLYSSSDDIEIQDAYVEVIADNWDDDIDDESDEKDIKDNSDEEFVLTFRLDDDIDDDETEVTVYAYGEDEEGNFIHYDELTFKLEIEREDDEIRIQSFSWNREPASCTDSYATLSVRIKNTGTDDQEEAAVLVEIEDLDYENLKRDIELDEGDSETVEFNVPVRGVAEGSYFVDITSYYNNNRRTDAENGVLTVRCADDRDTDSNTNNNNDNTNSGSDTTSDRSDSDDVIVITPPPSGNTANTGTNAPIYGDPVTATTATENTTYLIALGVIIVLLLLVIIVLAARLLRN